MKKTLFLETFFKGYEEQQAMMLLRSNEETYEMAEKAKKALAIFFSPCLITTISPHREKTGFLAKLLGSKESNEETESPWQFMIKFGIPYGDKGRKKSLSTCGLSLSLEKVTEFMLSYLTYHSMYKKWKKVAFIPLILRSSLIGLSLIKVIVIPLIRFINFLATSRLTNPTN